MADPVIMDGREIEVGDRVWAMGLWGTVMDMDSVKGCFSVSFGQGKLFLFKQDLSFRAMRFPGRALYWEPPMAVSPNAKVAKVQRKLMVILQDEILGECQ